MTAGLVVAEQDRRAYGWLAMVALVASCRLALWWSYLQALPAPAQVRPWAMAAACAAFASGLLWGGGAVVLFPHSESYRMLWVFLIGGMCAGAATYHAAHWPTMLAFVIPAALPLAVRLIGEGSLNGTVSSAMTVIFAVALTSSGYRTSRRFGRLLGLQFALAERTRDLDASNERLRDEMAQHRATEVTLRQAQKMEAMGQLTGGIAHDFNNLLTAVLGSLELLRYRLSGTDARALRLLDNAVRGAERGAALTQRLLAFGRRQALEPEIVDVPALVRAMSDLLHSSLGDAIRIETRFPGAISPAHVDANQLELALLNLAVNARRHAGRRQADDCGSRGGSRTRRAEGPVAGHLRGAQRRRQRRRHGRGDPRTGDGAVLHHQRGRQGHRTGAVDGVRPRRAVRRPARPAQPQGRGHDGGTLAASRGGRHRTAGRGIRARGGGAGRAAPRAAGR